MDQETFSEIDQFIGETIVAEDEALRAAVEAADDAGLPAIQVSRRRKAVAAARTAGGGEEILEFGTLGDFTWALDHTGVADLHAVARGRLREQVAVISSRAQ